MESAERLALATERARKGMKSGIGTQSERLLHGALKYYMEPDEARHEVPLEGFTADIYQAELGHIIEIQTRSFERLNRKLAAFLPHHRVTVVYPVAREKRLFWTDPETGEVTGGRLSPKRGRAVEILPEIYRIPDFQMHENLSFLIFMVDLEEYRLLDGWSHDQKKGSHRMERVPVSVAGIQTLHDGADYAGLIPDTLPEAFTRQELFQELKMQGRKGSAALSVLIRAGVLERLGVRERKHLYRRTIPADYIKV